MAIKEALNRLFQNTGKITYQETTFKDGHVFIKRETKEGPEAEREIRKHADAMTKTLEKFFKDF